MTRENLFDGRYRYDHIYPRGRSGEVLRAVDTHQNDRPVVIKRPAPHDAPPIRAGQEVNIRTERRALLQLKGHPVLANLLGEGTFHVGGQTHLYIVLERAEGVMLEQEVLELAKANERLPELEMLVIVDRLLDLLAVAHEHEIVYNDVDAKHLFWDRASYQLKVIDWGNAVFLEGDEITPQGISRQSDIYQTGELLYFILTGGQRLALNGETVDFGPDASRIPTRLQQIIQRAVHPVPDHRYPGVAALREDLAQYRRPLERDREAKLERIETRLQRQNNQRELERLLQEVEAVQVRDPGYPRARALREQIAEELHRLAILADLDAVRIYMESANWARSEALLAEIVERARGPQRDRARLLREIAAMLQASNTRPPAGIMPALEAIFRDDLAEAARRLLVTPENHPEARNLQWLLAERIQAYAPDVLVLRPHLLRLQMSLSALQRPYAPPNAADTVIDAVAALEEPSSGRLEHLTVAYQQLSDTLLALVDSLEERAGAVLQEPQQQAITSARLAAGTAQAIVTQLKVVAAQATANTAAASAALEAACVLDPVNPAFDSVRETLRSLRRTFDEIAHYRPQADGGDLHGWLEGVLGKLQPFADALPDPRLEVLIGSVQDARTYWLAFQDAVVAGNRLEALEALRRAADGIRRLHPELAAWLLNVRGVIEKARYVQRHAQNAAFGRAMADGWAAWDRGSGIEAERLARQALEEVTNDREAAAADRLVRLGNLLRSWKEGNGEGDPDLTARTDAALLALLTPEEERYWQHFTQQMPTAQAYLEAMGPRLIDHFEQTSTAGQRILFFHFVLRGVLDMYEDTPEDAEFWLEAARRALPNAEQHVACMALANVIRDRQSLRDLAGRIDAIQAPDDVPSTRKLVERSALYLLLSPLVDALRAVENGLAAWQQGDFRAAGGALEAALHRLADGERLAHVRLERFRAWLEQLSRLAAELHVVREHIADVAEQCPEEPDPRLAEWHERLVHETEAALGAAYARPTLAVWQKVYATVTGIYTDPARRRARKLRDMDELFNATAHIDFHPAYPLYRGWRQIIDTRPEFPAPPTDQPLPQYEEGGVRRPRSPLYTLDDFAPRVPRRRVQPATIVLGALAVLALAAVGLLFVLSSGGTGGTPAIAVTWETLTPTLSDTQIVAATGAAIETATAAALALLPTATDTPTPSPTPTFTATPTQTVAPTLDPGISFLPTTAPPPTETPTITPEPPTTTPQIAPVAVVEPVRGQQNVLLALQQSAQVYPWPQAWFKPGDLGGSWVLGVAEPDAGDNLLRVVLPADLLAQLFGPEAATRLRRLEATLTLRQYDPALIAENMVYFGLGLQGADESRVAVQVQLIRVDAINVGARVGDEFRARSTVPVGEGRVRLALERYDDGTVGLYLGDTPLGAPRFLTAPNAPVMPFLFVQQGGVVVSVTDLVATFD